MITGLFRRMIETIRITQRFRLLHLGETCRVQKFFFDQRRKNVLQKNATHGARCICLQDIFVPIRPKVPCSKLKRQRTICRTYTSWENGRYLSKITGIGA